MRDGGERHTVATRGGTRFNVGAIRERLIAYERSAERFRDIAARANAEVILSNHTPYDGTTVKLPALKVRRPGNRDIPVHGLVQIPRNRA